MRPLLNAPDTRLTTLQTEEEDSSVYNYSYGDDPEDATEYDNLLKHHHVRMYSAVEVFLKKYLIFHLLGIEYFTTKIGIKSSKLL